MVPEGLESIGGKKGSSVARKHTDAYGEPTGIYTVGLSTDDSCGGSRYPLSIWGRCSEKKIDMNLIIKFLHISSSHGSLYDFDELIFAKVTSF